MSSIQWRIWGFGDLGKKPYKMLVGIILKVKAILGQSSNMESVVRSLSTVGSNNLGEKKIS
jgi:hypothetical protein